MTTDAQTILSAALALVNEAREQLSACRETNDMIWRDMKRLEEKLRKDISDFQKVHANMIEDVGHVINEAVTEMRYELDRLEFSIRDLCVRQYLIERQQSPSSYIDQQYIRFYSD